MEKIKKLRKQLIKEKVDGYIIPKNDEFFSEYISNHNDRLKFISNFSGSFGFALILKNKNYLFVDGRYTLQAIQQSGKYFNVVTFPNKIPKDIDWLIQVEGHTDNLPISNSKYPSNWELSTSRAISVAKIMMENGIKSNKINVAGYGEFRPLAKNTSNKNRAKNRRIELKLTQP